jgi:hypothetical protein
LSQVAVRGGFGYAQVVVPLILFATLIVAFAAHTLRTRAVPIIDLRLFRMRSFAAGLTSSSSPAAGRSAYRSDRE